MKCILSVLSCLVLTLCADCSAKAAGTGDGNKQNPQNPVPVAPTPVVTPVVTVPVMVAVPVAMPQVVVPHPVAPDQVVAPAPVEKCDEPPPSPEPPAAEAAEPRRLVHYFCKAWKDKDYERMWWTMSVTYRKKVALKKFKRRFVSDAETNGGLLDENILETGKTKVGNESVKVELTFRFPKAKHRFVAAVAERQTGGQFRLVDSPFIPLDLDDL